MNTQDFFNHLLAHYSKNLPFVVYRKPGESGLNYLAQDDTQVHYTTDFKESGFVFSPFDKKEPAILIPGSPEQLTDYDAPVEELKISIDLTENVKDRELHVHLVSEAIKSIEATELKKVVLSRKEQVDLKESHPVHLFKNLLGKYKNAFVYLWHHPAVGTWLGATPETLLSLDSDRFETMALAGTQKYEGSLAVNWGAKEQHEQELVTQEILSQLETFDLKTIQIHDRETYRAGELLHLRTRISGNFNAGDHNLKKLLNALHPTPAVCGLPRDLAKTFIERQEKYDREYYTGFLGEINLLKDTSKKRNRRNVENLAYKTLKNTTRLFVNLRCMNYLNGQGFIYVGGGITQGSDPEQEWIETVNKAQTIASIL